MKHASRMVPILIQKSAITEQINVSKGMFQIISESDFQTPIFSSVVKPRISCNVPVLPARVFRLSDIFEVPLLQAFRLPLAFKIIRWRISLRSQKVRVLFHKSKASTLLTTFLTHSCCYMTFYIWRYLNSCVVIFVLYRKSTSIKIKFESEKSYIIAYNRGHWTSLPYIVVV